MMRLRLPGRGKTRGLLDAYVEFLDVVFVPGGPSFQQTYSVPAFRILLEKAPWTIFLSTNAMLFGILFGILLGSYMAYHEGSKFDAGMTASLTLNTATPAYLAGIFLLLYFGFKWRIFPDGGRYYWDATPGINWQFISSVFYYGTLPSLSLVVTGFGGKAIRLRANAIRLLGSDYIHVAKLRGLSRYRVATSYITRNSILPMYTRILIDLGTLLGGTAIIEDIYQYPGLGRLFVSAGYPQPNIPLLMAGLIIISGLMIVGTLIADLTYSLLDPRADVTVRRGGG